MLEVSLLIAISIFLLYKQYSIYKKHKEKLEYSIRKDYKRKTFWIKRSLIGILLSIILFGVHIYMNLESGTINYLIIVLLLVLNLIDLLNSQIFRTIYYNDDYFLYNDEEFHKKSVVYIKKARGFKGEIKLKNSEVISIPLEAIKEFTLLI